MAKSEPLIGYGLGMFPDVYPRYAIEDFPYHVNHAHSDWAEFAAEGGIPFLPVTEKGTDPSRISSVTTGNDGQTVQDYLVPAGANFEQNFQGTTPVNESEVKPQKRVPLPQRHHR